MSRLDNRWLLAALVSGCIVAAVSAQARPVGAFASLAQANSRVTIRTRDGEVIEIQPYSDGILRIRAGRNGVLPQPKDKSAAIVIGQPDPNVAVTVRDMGSYHELRTARVTLRINHAPLTFEAFDTASGKLLWREMRPIDLAEKASVQTLSKDADEQFYGGGQQNGKFAFNGELMEIGYSGGWEEGDRPSPAPFYMSSKGYGILRNSWAPGSYDFRSDGFLTAQHSEDGFDGFFIFGDTFRDVLNGYTRLTGRAGLLPRWAFEYGDADCYNDANNVKKPRTTPDKWSDGPTGKTPDVVTSVAAQYRKYDVPGGWILPNDGYGCGYADLPRTVKELSALGFHTGLWTEKGMDKIAWEVGTAGTRVQKIDVAWSGKGYQFALDANQAAAEGILKNSDSRPFVWTVMGWAGIQRYAVTWTGDQSGSWDYIRWHVPTLIGSGLSGMVYSTGDVDGIFGGSPETYTRDLQWKSFTPVLMGMSGWSDNERKHPWWFDEPYRSINRDYLKLKMRLTPYMYTTAHEAEQTAAPIVRGLMWDHPNDPNATSEKYKYQFFLGRDFLVAPVYKSQAESKGWRAGVYLPQGDWVDYWDGRVTSAGARGRVIDYPVTLEKLPVLVRAGAIIPMYPTALFDGQVPKDVVTFDVYPRGQSSYTFYEDDGSTRQYKTGAFTEQTVSVSAPETGAGRIAIDLAPPKGRYVGQLPQRAYEFLVHSRFAPSKLVVDGQLLMAATKNQAAGLPKSASFWYYDPADRYGTVHVRVGTRAISQSLSVQIEAAPGAQVQPTPAYPVMPPRGTEIPPDTIKLIERPLEEAGHSFENVWDGKPDTWFRSSRDQALAYGPIEFTLYFGDRKAITGFDIAPRNDENWQYGQVGTYEIYVSDVNGEWGKPVQTGKLKLDKGMQSVRFAPVYGRLLRFRITSIIDPEGSNDSAVDPMKSGAVGGGDVAAATDTTKPVKLGSVTISEFRVHEQPPSDTPDIRRPLVDLPYQARDTAAAAVRKVTVADAQPMQMNGLAFGNGFQVTGTTRFDLAIGTGWNKFRADIGVDDRCVAAGGVRFEVWGDDKLLYGSGSVLAPAVFKPEIDVRGVTVLSLRTIPTGKQGSASNPAVCGNWANPVLIGQENNEMGSGIRRTRRPHGGEGRNGSNE